jgi:hypothetical protein
MALRDTTWVLLDTTAGIPDSQSLIRYDNATRTSYEHYLDTDRKLVGTNNDEQYGYLYTRTVDRKKYKWVALTEDAADNAMDFKSWVGDLRWEVDIDNEIIRSRVLSLEVDKTDGWIYDTKYGTWPA